MLHTIPYQNNWAYNDISRLVSSQVLLSESCIFCNVPLIDLPEDYLGDDNYEVLTELQLCPNCGWWSVSQAHSDKQMWDDELERMVFLYGGIGSLKELSLNDINEPLAEIRQYLIGKFGDRFVVNPKVFENVVASVFRNLDQNVVVTAYSGDGGIDAVMTDGSDLVGVQVKRYKSKIEVEQIRAFAGALYLHGYSRGVFVTTSDYQAGCKRTARLYAERGLPIQLYNAQNFYSALELSHYNTHSNWATREKILSIVQNSDLHPIFN